MVVDVDMGVNRHCGYDGPEQLRARGFAVVVLGRIEWEDDA
jgi:hypothetical protein